MEERVVGNLVDLHIFNYKYEWQDSCSKSCDGGSMIRLVQSGNRIVTDVEMKSKTVTHNHVPVSKQFLFMPYKEIYRFTTVNMCV